VAGLGLRAEQARTSAGLPGIGDPAGVLNGGGRALIPFSRGLVGVVVAESAPQLSGKQGRFRLSEKIASGFAGDLRLFDWGSSSPESGHLVKAVAAVSRRNSFPSCRKLHPLKEVMGSRPTKGAQTRLAERDSLPQREAETDDGYGDLFRGVLSWSETVGSDGRSTESFDLTDRTLNRPWNSLEAVPVILSATSDDRLDALCTQGMAGRFAVVSEICDEDIRMTARPRSLARNGGGVGDCLQDLSVIAGIRQRGVDDERHAVSVQDGSVVRRHFPAVNRAWAGAVTAAECANHDAIADGQLGFKDPGLPGQAEQVRLEVVSEFGIA